MSQNDSALMGKRHQIGWGKISVELALLINFPLKVCYLPRGLSHGATKTAKGQRRRKFS